MGIIVVWSTAEHQLGAAAAAATWGSDFDVSLPVLEVPDTVQAGVGFPVTVRTYAPSTCYAADGGRVSADGLTASIIPYDLDLTRSRDACGSAVMRLPRSFDLTFSTAGVATVAVTGRGGGAGDSNGELHTIEATVVVRE